MEFNIYKELDRMLSEIGLSVADIGGKVEFIGEDPILKDSLRLGAISALPTMAAAVGAATIWKMRSGQGQNLSIDLRKSIHNLNPGYKFQPTINGFHYPTHTIYGNMFLGDMYRTKDNRFVMPSAIYSRMMINWLNFLHCEPDKKAVEAAILKWDSKELEDKATEANLPISICRTPEEWLEHPAGQFLANKPLIEIKKIGESQPKPFSKAERPLSGIRVLTPVHAIAGPVVGRTLAEQGAEVLHITIPDDFEHEMIYDDANIGMCSTYLDFNDPNQNKIAHALASTADVFVENYRKEVMRKFDFTPEQLAESNPGIVYVSVKCYGYDGPWQDRAGFDYQGTAASGLTYIEGNADKPAMPVTHAINDYVAGYLGAVGALAALIRRAKEGGSYHVIVSLTRSAMWYPSLGIVDSSLFDSADEKHKLLPAGVITSQTAFGQLIRLEPPVQFSKTPAYWDSPVLVPKGSCKPEWVTE